MSKIEKEWEHNGLQCLAIIAEFGHRCGYVGLPVGHPWFEREYNGFLDEVLDVHGGVTYSGHLGNDTIKPAIDGLWWVGFDCAHYGDLPDVTEIAADAFELRRIMARSERQGVIRTLEFVTEQCESMADQIIEESAK